MLADLGDAFSEEPLECDCECDDCEMDCTGALDGLTPAKSSCSLLYCAIRDGMSGGGTRIAGGCGISAPGFREPSATAARYVKLACSLFRHLLKPVEIFRIQNATMTCAGTKHTYP